MIRKYLIIFALVAVCTAPSLAHVMWAHNATTAVKWQWEEHPGSPVCVSVKVVMWAKLYFCENDPVPCLNVFQMPTANPGLWEAGDFVGCICMKLCINFAGVKIGVEYLQVNWDAANAAAHNGGTPYGPYDGISTTDPTIGNDGKNYAISVAPAGSMAWSDWSDSPSASMNETQMHLSGHELLLDVCLKVRNVDPQALIATGQGEFVYLGTIVTTLTPTIAPPPTP